MVEGRLVTYVLDSSAVLRYLDGEAGADRVSEIIKGHLAGGCEAVISSVHWGEIAGHICRRRGRGALDTVLSRLAAFGIPVVAVDSSRAVRALRPYPPTHRTGQRSVPASGEVRKIGLPEPNAFLRCRL